MSEEVMLEEVERLVEQLSPRDQLKIVARIGERLSEETVLEEDIAQESEDYLRQIEAFLAMCDELAASTEGEVDAADDLRQIRAERAERLAQL